MGAPRWSVETQKNDYGDDVDSTSSAVSKMDYRRTVLSKIKRQASGQGDQSATIGCSCHAAVAASVARSER